MECNGTSRIAMLRVYNSRKGLKMPIRGSSWRWVLPLVVGGAGLLPHAGHAAVACGLPDSKATSVCHIDPTIDPAALCNDGTLPAFWIRLGSGSGASTWVIWLEGGGQCTDKISCELRAERTASAALLTSRGFTAEFAAGVLSPDHLINPSLYNANTVFVHYCSSDDWSGNYASTSPYNHLSPTTWNFQGRRIVSAAIASLNELGIGFAQAGTVLLGGSSAGGVGATVNANDVLPVLPATAHMLLANDAGFTIDIGQFDATEAAPYIYPGHPNAFENNYEQGISLWHGRGDVNCAAHASTLLGQAACYNTSLLLQQGYIAVPSFVAESQIDKIQLADEICPTRYGTCQLPSSPLTATGQYALAFQNQMGSALIGEGTPAAYSVTSPDAYLHEILGSQYDFVSEYTVAGGGSISPRDVFDTWLADPGGTRATSLATGPGIAGGVTGLRR
jgi:hypothetical protein